MYVHTNTHTHTNTHSLCNVGVYCVCWCVRSMRARQHTNQNVGVYCVCGRVNTHTTKLRQRQIDAFRHRQRAEGCAALTKVSVGFRVRF